MRIHRIFSNLLSTDRVIEKKGAAAKNQGIRLSFHKNEGSNFASQARKPFDFVLYAVIGHSDQPNMRCITDQISSMCTDGIRQMIDTYGVAVIAGIIATAT